VKRKEKHSAAAATAVQVQYRDTTKELAKKKKSVPILAVAAGLSGEQIRTV